MPTDFDVISTLYSNNKFAELVHHHNGIYWLKLRSVSRIQQLRQLCDGTGIEYEGIPGRQLLAHVYRQEPDEVAVDGFINDLYEQERRATRLLRLFSFLVRFASSLAALRQPRGGLCAVR